MFYTKDALKILLLGNISRVKTLTKNANDATVFENHRKSLIHHCERSELRLHFEFIKMLKMVNLASF